MSAIVALSSCHQCQVLRRWEAPIQMRGQLSERMVSSLSFDAPVRGLSMLRKVSALQMAMLSVRDFYWTMARALRQCARWAGLHCTMQHWPTRLQQWSCCWMLEHLLSSLTITARRRCIGHAMGMASLVIRFDMTSQMWPYWIGWAPSTACWLLEPTQMCPQNLETRLYTRLLSMMIRAVRCGQCSNSP